MKLAFIFFELIGKFRVCPEFCIFTQKILGMIPGLRRERRIGKLRDFEMREVAGLRRAIEIARSAVGEVQFRNCKPVSRRRKRLEPLARFSCRALGKEEAIGLPFGAAHPASELVEL